MRRLVNGKILVFLVCTIGILLLLFLFYIQPELEYKGLSERLQKGDTTAKERIFEILDTSKSKQRKIELVQQFLLANSHATEQGYDIYISSVFMTSSGTSSIRIHLEESVPYLLGYLDYAPVDYYFILATEQLIEYYFLHEQWVEAERILKLVEQRVTGTAWEEREDITFLKVKLYIHKQELDKAELALHYYRQLETERLSWLIQQPSFPLTYAPSVRWTQLLAEIYMKRGEYELAFQVVEEGIRELELVEEWEAQRLVEISDHSLSPEDKLPSELENLRESLRQIINSGQVGWGKIHGQIRRNDGAPLPQVGVFLRTPSNVHRSPMATDSYFTITDNNGNYQLGNIPPGEYQLALGLSHKDTDGWVWAMDPNEWLQVRPNDNIEYSIRFMPLVQLTSPVNHDSLSGEQVHFVWGEVEGADYYVLNVGTTFENGTYLLPIRTHLKENSISIAVDELYATPIAVRFSHEVQELLDPEGILAFANPEGTFYWAISAHDKDGRLISRSNGYTMPEEGSAPLPYFHLHHRELTTADQYLLKGMLEQAMEQYEKEYTNAGDVHALRMLLRLNRWGGRGEIVHSTYEQYIEALASQAQSHDELYQAVNYYLLREEWERFHLWYDAFEAFLAQMQQPMQTYVQSQYAIALIRQGMYEEAGTLLASVVPEDRGSPFVGLWLAIELYLGTSLEKVQTLASHYPERVSTRRTDWSKLLLEVQKELDSERNMEYLRRGLEYSFQGNKELSDFWRNERELPAIHTLAEAVSNVK